MIRFLIVQMSAVAMLMTTLPSPVYTADVLRWQVLNAVEGRSGSFATASARISGRASVIDGRTLWLPRGRHLVRLAAIDACELPQWSYDPRRHGETTLPKPVPCGALAKAWLKRIIANAQVSCILTARDVDGALLGQCTGGGKDLALKMLQAGWARVRSPAPAEYLTAQHYAMLARHGMWATYVLDMQEWRAKAIDRTLSRHPIADFNLLADRESEISPPFEDARRRPRILDR